MQAEVCTATVTPTPASAREISSSTRMYERKSAPAPPYSSGTHTPISPRLAELHEELTGKGVRPIPRGGVGLDLDARDVPGECLDLALLRCQLEVHDRQTTPMRLAGLSLCALALMVGPTACGGHAAHSAEQIARTWSAALDRNDNESAANLFAANAQIVQNGELTLQTHSDAVRWNASLPCGGKIISVTARGKDAVLVVFQLDERPKHSCDGPGVESSRPVQGRARQDRALAPDGGAAGHAGAGRLDRLDLELGLELVADAEPRLDERMRRRLAVDLLAQPPHEDVDGAVAVRLATAPHLLEQLVACHDAAAVERQRVEELELRRRERRALPVDERLHLARIDPELLDLDRIAALLLGGAHAPARRSADASDELSHRERLHEVVVGPDLERVHAVVLGAASGDDDDRRADPFGAGRLDQLPAVELRQHEVEDADVRVLEAQARQAELAPPDDDRVESGRPEVPRHPIGDHVVVLDDQHACHVPTIDRGAVRAGFRNGDDLVKREHDIYDRSFDELRTGFTAAVSHELRTPLARILVLLESADLPGADVRALIDQARNEVENAGELIDEILFLSELESGREIVALGRTQALPILEGVAADLADGAARAGVTVVVDGDPSVELPLRPRMLRILVENLAENAVRYAGHGATLTLSVRRAGDFGVLTAADDGSGVDAETLERLFERFYRGDAARTSRGTGLGLAIVKHLVAAAGGEIEADGARGRGLRIRATFPD